MCLRLTNDRHCLSLLTVLGILQIVLAIPIVVLSFFVFFTSSLGIALSPFWCGFVLLTAGLFALLIRPTRLACVIFFHVLLNSFAISACFLSAGITGIYGTAVHLPGYQEFMDDTRRAFGNGTCIFDQNSNLYAESFRSSLEPVDSLVSSCEDLDSAWTFLVSIMSLSFIGFLISIVAIFSDCLTPCVEQKYEGKPRTSHRSRHRSRS